MRDGLWSVFYFVEALILWQHCERNRVRHIHAHFASAPSDLAWLAASFGNRVRGEGEPPWSWSMTVHGWHEFVDERKHSLGEKAAAADFVICISEYTRSQLMRQVDPTVWPRLHVRHCGIDPDMFSPAKAGAASPGTVLCVGRLDAEKGHLVLVDALAALRGRGLDATAVFVGAGPLRPVIEERIAALGLDRRGAPHGRDRAGRDQGLLRPRSAFCLPTFIEGLPVVLMEAMASGLPVVTTPVNGIPELVQDGVTGLLVPPGRPDLLADALQRLLSDPDLRARLADRARARVVAQHDIRAIGPAIANLFRSAAGVRRS